MDLEKGCDILIATPGRLSDMAPPQRARARPTARVGTRRDASGSRTRIRPRWQAVAPAWQSEPKASQSVSGRSPS